MVNTRTDAELLAAVQNALQTLLPQIRAEIREEFRTGSGPLDSGGNPPPVTIHTWLERFNKQKPRSFEKATTLVDVKNWISHIEKIFDVMGSNLNNGNTTLLQLLDLLVHNFDGLFKKVKLVINLDLIQRFTPHLGLTLLMIMCGLNSTLNLNNLLSSLVDDLWATSLAVHVMTSLSMVSILSEVVNLLRGGNISTGIKYRASAGEAGVGDSQHLLGGDPTDDYGKDRGLLRDGLEREGGGGGEDEYVTIYASTRARVDGGRGGGSYPGEITGARKIVSDEPSGSSSSRFKAAEIAGSLKGSDSKPMAGAR
nr:zinc finger, CCHC-type, retrotransposon Gag domain protein [Tanacetum cinerariifolium]